MRVGRAKGSFFKVRRFHDREDLERQLIAWLEEVNTQRPSRPTDEIPADRMEAERLHLPTIRLLYPEVEDRAEVEGLSQRDYLAILVAEEFAHRAGTRIRRATRKAHFPYLCTAEEFDFKLQTSVRLSLLGSYLGPESVTEGRSLILGGRSGWGGNTSRGVDRVRQPRSQGSRGSAIPSRRLFQRSWRLTGQRIARRRPEGDVLVDGHQFIVRTGAQKNDIARVRMRQADLEGAVWSPT